MKFLLKILSVMMVFVFAENIKCVQKKSGSPSVITLDGSVLPVSQQKESNDTLDTTILKKLEELIKMQSDLKKMQSCPEGEDKRKHVANSISDMKKISEAAREIQNWISSKPGHFGKIVNTPLSPRAKPIIAHCEMVTKQYEKTIKLLDDTKQVLQKFMLDNHIVPFRIGFEFQMGGDVLPWAKTASYKIQKTPLFEMRYKNKKLWHVEIDSTDIEFVTEPFAFYEQEYLTVCMKSINNVLEFLKKTDEKNNVSFKQWLTQIERKISKTNYYIHRTNEYFEFKIDKKLINKIVGRIEFAPQVTIQFPLKYAIDICCHLRSSLECVAASIPFSFRSHLKDTFFEKSEDKCSFRSALGGLMFLHACTMYDMMIPTIEMSKQIIKDELRKKIKLKNEELSNIENFALCSELQDKIDELQSLIQEIEENRISRNELIKQRDISIIGDFYSPSASSQRDAKAKLHFMSRRPFSEMLKNMTVLGSVFLSDDFSKITLSSHDNYTNLFMSEMNSNLLFSGKNILKDFEHAVYAEQFYDTQGQIIDCSGLYQYFDKFDDDAGNKIQALLKRGVIATTIIRHLKIKKPAYLFKDDYGKAIVESIGKPGKGLVFSIKNDSYSIEEDVWNFDLLSPPFPLCKGIHFVVPPRDQDGMGAYNGYHKKYMTEDFGAAIIEFRRIDCINEDFLKKHFPEDCDDMDCRFLHYPENFEQESLALFNCINDIEDEENLRYTEFKLWDFSQRRR